MSRKRVRWECREIKKGIEFRESGEVVSGLNNSSPMLLNITFIIFIFCCFCYILFEAFLTLFEEIIVLLHTIQERIWRTLIIIVKPVRGKYEMSTYLYIYICVLYV